jgi:hypothetical protein
MIEKLFVHYLNHSNKLNVTGTTEMGGRAMFHNLHHVSWLRNQESSQFRLTKEL